MNNACNQLLELVHNNVNVNEHAGMNTQWMSTSSNYTFAVQAEKKLIGQACRQLVYNFT